MQDRRTYWEKRLVQEMERAERAETDHLRELQLGWAEMYRRRLRTPLRAVSG